MTSSKEEPKTVRRIIEQTHRGYDGGEYITIDQALSALTELIEKEVIGNDEPEYSLDNPNWGQNRIKNQLRAEQRNKLHGGKI